MLPQSIPSNYVPIIVSLETKTNANRMRNFNEFLSIDSVAYLGFYLKLNKTNPDVHKQTRLVFNIGKV